MKRTTARMIVRAATWLLLALPLAPVLAQLRQGDFAGAGAILSVLGRLTGIAGLSCLLLSAALSIRLPGFDRWLGGLVSLWKTHHRLGAAGFILLLAHPLLLVFAAADSSLAMAVQMLLPPPDAVSTWLGWLALLTMMVFLAPSFAFFGEPEYQRWKWLHRSSSVAVVLALAHSFMLARKQPGDWSWIAWGGLAMLAALALSYRFVFSRRFGRLSYRIADIRRPANNVVELVLQAEGHALEYQPGQFIYLTPHDRQLAAGHGEEHPYALTSSPLEPDLRVAIKALGDFSRAMQRVAPGSQVSVEGPYGCFFPERPGPELWIAGGIGIAPFLARARHFAISGSPANVVLIFCVQDESRALFREELERLSGNLEGFSLTMHFFYREGPLDARFLTRHCPDALNRAVFVCGPAPLIACATRLLLAAGHSRKRIHSEEFALL